MHNKQFSQASQMAAFLGLVPKHSESGLFKGKSRLAKNGSSDIRAKLYMPALVAIKHNPDIKAQYERLLANGKCKMQAVCAAMRKLVHICFGVIKHQQSYQAKVELISAWFGFFKMVSLSCCPILLCHYNKLRLICLVYQVYLYGFFSIYVAKLTDTPSNLAHYKHLHKVGFSTLTGEARTKHSIRDTAFLQQPVDIIAEWQVYDANARSVGGVLHAFFYDQRVKVSLKAANDNLYKATEWFNVPLDEIEKAINLVIAGDIKNYRMDGAAGKVVLK